MLEAKEYLQRIRRCDTIINSKLAEVDSLYGMITRITPVLKDDVGSGGGGSQDKIGNALAKIVDLKNDINHDVDTFVDLKREATALLEKLDNPLHYEILHKRYILYQTFERIAADMDFTHRWVCKLHGRALQAFGKAMKEKGVG